MAFPHNRCPKCSAVTGGAREEYFRRRFTALRDELRSLYPDQPQFDIDQMARSQALDQAGTYRWCCRSTLMLPPRVALGIYVSGPNDPVIEQKFRDIGLDTAQAYDAARLYRERYRPQTLEGPLTPEELDEIQRQPLFGTSSSDLLRELSEIGSSLAPPVSAFPTALPEPTSPYRVEALDAFAHLLSTDRNKLLEDLQAADSRYRANVQRYIALHTELWSSTRRMREGRFLRAVADEVCRVAAQRGMACAALRDPEPRVAYMTGVGTMSVAYSYVPAGLPKRTTPASVSVALIAPPAEVVAPPPVAIAAPPMGIRFVLSTGEEIPEFDLLEEIRAMTAGNQ